MCEHPTLLNGLHLAAETSHLCVSQGGEIVHVASFKCWTFDDVLVDLRDLLADKAASPLCTLETI